MAKAARRERGRRRVGHPPARDAQHGRAIRVVSIGRGKDPRRSPASPSGRRSDSRGPAGRKPRRGARDRSLRGGRRVRHGTATPTRASTSRAPSWPGSPPPVGRINALFGAMEAEGAAQILATGVGRAMAGGGSPRCATPEQGHELSVEIHPAVSVRSRCRPSSAPMPYLHAGRYGYAEAPGHAARGDQLEARDQLWGSRGGSGDGLVPRGREARARGRGPCISPRARRLRPSARLRPLSDRCRRGDDGARGDRGARDHGDSAPGTGPPSIVTGT